MAAYAETATLLQKMLAVIPNSKASAIEAASFSIGNHIYFPAGL